MPGPISAVEVGDAMLIERLNLTTLNLLITTGNELLQKLCSTVHAATNQEGSQWNKRIDMARSKPVMSCQMIGLIGATGVGKSSLGNALLDRECLVPTSCMQACTATVIEIHWNDSSEVAYRAEVDIITTQEWRAEINTLLGDATDDLSKLNDMASEAGVAFKKITAVYPFINKKNIQSFSGQVDSLMGQEYIQQLLGQQICLTENDPKLLHAKLSRYMEGKEKLASTWEHADLSADKMLDRIEYWPLIRKVRIFMQAYILETGCVLVDLPGVADTNTARGSIAEKYIGKCANLWIVAPIVRAVDDKVARTLLGEGFKRQLQRDGVLSRVAFVCSKSDDLVIRELRNRLQFDTIFMQRIGLIDSKKNCIESRYEGLTKKIADTLQDARKADEEGKAVAAEHALYLSLSRMAKNGTEVHPPILRRSKRTLTTTRSPAKKQPRILDYLFSQPSATQDPTNDMSKGDVQSDDTELKRTEAGDENLEQDMTQPALKAEDIRQKLEELKLKKRQLQENKEDAREKVQEYRDDLESLKAERASLEDEEWDAYVEGRNNYCSECIGQDFMDGIRDMQTDETQANDEDFDPDEEVEPCVLPQQELPVFCTSSQGFQKLRGRLQGEKVSSKFSNLEQTGIPELVRYCHSLGKSELMERRETYVEGIKQLLTSIRFWLAGPGNKNVSDESQNMEEAMEDLIKDTSNIVQNGMTDIRNLMSHRLFSKFNVAAGAAQEMALEIVAKWAAPIRDASPGLRYPTYKAVVRRGGRYTKKGREIDFRDDLLKPLMEQLDGSWNSVLNEAVPLRINGIVKKVSKRIDLYRTKLDETPEFLAAPERTAHMYQKQVSMFKRSLRNSIVKVKDQLRSHQQTANRQFGTVVAEKLEAVCDDLAKDFGKGVFQRMKIHMNEYVDSNKGHMFHDAVATVKASLEAGVVEVSEDLAEYVEKSCEARRRDCQTLFAKTITGVPTIPEESKESIEEVIRELEALLDCDTTQAPAAAADSATSDIPGATSTTIKKELDSTVGRDFSLPVPASVATSIDYEESTDCHNNFIASSDPDIGDLDELSQYDGLGDEEEMEEKEK